MSTPYIDLTTGDILVRDGDQLVNSVTRKAVAKVIDGIPRFVAPDENYAESFGWQWNHWENIRSEKRGDGLGLRELILKRTHFDEYEMAGKRILECGMGGGDDTEVLLSLPFAEVHAFDLSSAVERAKKFLETERLWISQASIFDIPYPDRSFDFVFCHRVLQHTPDPAEALRCICRKVKDGGILFAHAYKRSDAQMSEWRYKYRWLTKRLPRSWIFWYVCNFGGLLHRINNRMYARKFTRDIAWRFLPFYRSPAKMEEESLIELDKLITFDALTPWHDHPMATEELVGIIESEGFQIEHLYDPTVSPVYCTARRLVV